MTVPPNHRRRFTAGVLLATALGLAVSHAMLRAGLREVADSASQRLAAVSLSALAELSVRAGGKGDPLRKVVSAWQERTPSARAARVVVFDGLSLEASTAAADTGEKAAPRRLSRDEKPLYDVGQLLRAAVETNREEGQKRKKEIELLPGAPAAALALAEPLELEGGVVVGMVSLEAVTQPREVGASPWVPAGTFLGTALAFAAAALALARKPSSAQRGLLAVISVAATTAGLSFFGWYSFGELEKARRQEHEQVSAWVHAQADAVRAVLNEQALEGAESLRPGAWDVDAYRSPLGVLDGQGAVLANGSDARAMLAERSAWRALSLLFAAALGLMLVTGFGGLSRLGATLVQHRQAYAYIAPAILGTLVLVFFPFIYGITLSFTGSNLYNSSQSIAETWVGFKNYGEILGNFQMAARAEDGSWAFNYENFYWTFLFTVAWTVSNVTIGVTVGLVLALILNTKDLFLRPVYRVLLILPWAVPNYITALIWKGMFHQQFGVINQVIQLLGGEPVSWFASPGTSFVTALATNGWLSFPFMMVVSLGALQSIPGELYEAARVDGASRWQQFANITLPALKPALVPAVILSVVWTFNMFNIVYLVTAGEPAHSTEILVTQAYKFAFEKYQYGYAAAYSTVIFGILLIYGTIQNRVSRATEAA
ncbi:MAG TPA: sugar ABC transporter permease [Myxococcaceae bacterium]|jgi:arabinogalactan oligomer/maltooligosaccharide transport system permease protein